MDCAGSGGDVRRVIAGQFSMIQYGLRRWRKSHSAAGRVHSCCDLSRRRGLTTPRVAVISVPS